MHLLKWLLYDRDLNHERVNGLRQFLPNESPLKMMENAFYFILKALLVLKIFKYLP